MKTAQLYVRVSKEAGAIINEGAALARLSQSEYVEKILESNLGKLAKKIKANPEKDYTLCLTISKQTKATVSALSKKLNISMSDLTELAIRS